MTETEGDKIFSGLVKVAEALWGVADALRRQRPISCTTCQGEGRQYRGGRWLKCDACGGKGF